MDLPLLLISSSTGFADNQIKAVYQLISDGATIPFISRYRKDRTGSLDELAIEKIVDQLDFFEKVKKRKESVLKLLLKKNIADNQILAKISESWDLTEIEDLYLPFKEVKKSNYSKALTAGLSGLAKIILSQKTLVSKSQILAFKTTDYNSEKEIIEGVNEIVVRWIAERKKVRSSLRDYIARNGEVVSKLKTKCDDQELILKYKDYHDFSEPIYKIKSHRFLALQRANDEGVVSLGIRLDKKKIMRLISSFVICDQSSVSILNVAIERSWVKILKPALEKEFFKQLKQDSDLKAIGVFSENLRQLLLQPPLRNKRLLAIDPGFKSGCKLVCLSAEGSLLGNATIYPHPPQNQFNQSKKKIAGLIEQYKLDGIAVGNGTASRETEKLIKGTRFNGKVNVYIVNEAGASVYSASAVARKEFPDYDVTVRGAISIGRRLIDPLSELVKIDPKSIGVGQYQHDVNQQLLSQKLDNVVASAVNSVGVDLNTASEFLLKYVSGIGPKLAERLVEYREEHGSFKSRENLKDVPGLGDGIFEQSAGFLRIKGGVNPLDDSAIHPECYSLVNTICEKEDVLIAELIGNEARIEKIKWSNYVNSDFGLEAIKDLKQELAKPGLDPRKIIYQLEFDKSLKSIQDVKVGAVVAGVVNNVTNFGAFVDIGIKENGLIHISHLSEEYIDDPTEIVKVHQHVKAKIISVDVPRKRIGLSLIGV